MRWQDISSNLFNVCAFKNSIGEVLPKIYFKSQVEKLSFLIQALQSIKANKNYSSFMVWHLTYNPNIQELFSLIFTHNISTKDYLFLFIFCLFGCLFLQSTLCTLSIQKFKHLQEVSIESDHSSKSYPTKTKTQISWIIGL